MAGLEEASGSRWQIRFADGRADVSRLVRLARYFLFPLKFLLSTSKIDHVVAWQQFYGILTSAYSRILHRSFPITIMTFIHKPKKGLLGKFFNKLVRFGIENPNVRHIIVFSPDEVDSYSRLFPAAADKFLFLPLGIHEKELYANKSDIEGKKPYLFSAGRSNRNYDILKHAAEETHTHLRIACPEEKATGFRFTKILTDCFDKDMNRQLHGAFAIAVPLHDRPISSGQLAVLQAMRAGKPVIVSRHASLMPYIIEGKTAIVCSDRNQWKKAIITLRDNPHLARRIGMAGQEHFLSNFTLRRLGRELGMLI